MDKTLWGMVLVLCIWLLSAGTCFGKQVYLRDGGIIECKSFHRRGEVVTVVVNRDTVVDLDRREVNMQRTFRKAGKNAHRVRKTAAAPLKAAASKQPAVTPAAPPARPATSAAPVARPVSPPAVKPAPPAAVKPVAKPAAPPAPAVKPTAPPAPTAKAAAAAQTAPKPAAAVAPPATAPAPLPEPVKKAEAQPETTKPSPAEPAAPASKADLESRRQQAKAMMTEALQKNDPELMKKAMELQRSTLQPEEQAKAAGRGLKLLLILLICSLLIVISMWVVFEKAGCSGWKSLIPFYNLYILMEISGKPGWWMFLTLIPVVGFIIYLLAMLALAEKFGRGALFGIGLCFLPMFMFPVLAFGGSEYEAWISKAVKADEFTFSE